MIGAGSQTSNVDRSDSIIYSNAVSIDASNDDVHQDDGTDIGTLMGAGSWTYTFYIKDSVGAWSNSALDIWAKGDNTLNGNNFISFRLNGMVNSTGTANSRYPDYEQWPNVILYTPSFSIASKSGGTIIQSKTFGDNGVGGNHNTPIRGGDIMNTDNLTLKLLGESGIPKGDGTVPFPHSYRSANAYTKGFVMFTITCDASGTNRDFKLYINGQEIPAKSGVAEVTLASSTNFESHVGSATFNQVKYFNLLNAGALIQLGPQAFWDSVLTEAEIKEIYYSAPTLTSNFGDYTSSGDLQRWYKFDEGTGTSVADSSGNSGQAFDLVNGPAWVKENIVM
jgi:hypothetical protein